MREALATIPQETWAELFLVCAVALMALLMIVPTVKPGEGE